MIDVEARTMRKVTGRFVPLLIVCFIVAFLDRVNVGFAALTMSADLKFTSTVFGTGAGLFFIGYFFFEIPSNIALERVGARRWIARIMLTWGVLSALTAFITGPWTFVGINFGLSFFLPQIVRGFHLTLMQVGLVAAIPFVVGGLGMIWWGRRSDRHDERRFHLLFPLALGIVGLGGSTLVAIPALKLALLCLASFGVFSALPIFWALLPGLLGPTVVAIGFAAINSLGNLSGFAAPYAVGVIADATGSTAGGLQIIAVYGCVAWSILAVVTRYHRIPTKQGKAVPAFNEARG